MKKKSNSKVLLTGIVWVLYFLWILYFAGTALTLSNFFMYVLFLGIMVILYYRDLKIDLKEFNKEKKKNISKVFIYLLLFFGVYIFSNFIVGVLQKVISFDSSNSVIYGLFKNMPYGTLFAGFLTIIFYPIVEELIFRKSLKDVIKNPVLFVIVSSLLTWYFQVTIINPSVKELVIAIPSLISSILLSIIYVKKGNIFYTIFPRILYNIIICGIQFVSLLAK